MGGHIAICIVLSTLTVVDYFEILVTFNLLAVIEQIRSDLLLMKYAILDKLYFFADYIEI